VAIVTGAAFVREFLRSPMTVASVAPSSQTLARRMVLPIPATGDPVVVELGPGTGAFTGSIQRLLDGRGRHVAIDVNERFTDVLAGRFPGVEAVTADAGDLVAVLSDRGLSQADVIVSGLPWAAFGRDLQRRLLGAVAESLAPDGVFTTFAYVHARWSTPAVRFRHAVQNRFEEVVLGRTVWANLPPALVYYCRRPAGAQAAPPTPGTETRGR
jgi:phosphatidylethanolamine/phosphatidyl-N-methylethanolamine N-methyltransferase